MKQREAKIPPPGQGAPDRSEKAGSTELLQATRKKDEPKLQGSLTRRENPRPFMT